MSEREERSPSGATVLRPGQVIDGRFRTETLLGTGGFGEVWRASSIDAEGPPVAIKVLSPKRSSDKKIRARFVKEAAVLMALDHPQIARAVASNVEGPLAWLAMEYVEGRSLRDVIAERGETNLHFSPPDLASLARQVCSAIGFAHAAGILHRDLKPGNVMVKGFGPSLSAKVLDFGIAKILGESATQATTQGRILGSPLYLTPEQIRGLAFEQASDVFALAVVLFEAMTLKHPWLRDREGRAIAPRELTVRKDRAVLVMNVPQHIAVGPRPAVTPLRPDLPAALDAVFARATAIDPAARYESVEAFFEAFAGALAAKPRVPDATTVRDDLVASEEGPTAELGVTAKPMLQPVVFGDALPSLGPVVPQDLRADASRGEDPDPTVTAPGEATPPLPGVVQLALTADSISSGEAIVRSSPARAPGPSPQRKTLLLVAVSVAAGIAIGVGSTRLAREEPRPAPASTVPERDRPPAVEGAATPVAKAPAVAAPIAAPPAERAAPAHEEAPASPTSSRPSRTRRAAAPPTAPDRPAARVRTALRALLEQAKASGDEAKIRELADKIAAAAAPVSDAKLRGVIKKRAASAAMMLDVAELERCIGLLESAPVQ